MLRQPQIQKYLGVLVSIFFLFTSVVSAHHGWDDPQDVSYPFSEFMDDATRVALEFGGYPTPSDFPRGVFSVPGDNIFPDYPMTVSGSSGLETVKVLNPLRPVEQYPLLLRPGEKRVGNVVYHCPDCDGSTSGYIWDPMVPTNRGFFGPTTTSLNLTQVTSPESTYRTPSQTSQGHTSNSSRTGIRKGRASIRLITFDEGQRRRGESGSERARRLNYGPRTRQALGIAPYSPKDPPNQTKMIEHHN